MNYENENENENENKSENKATMKIDKKKLLPLFLVLQASLFLSSLSGVCSKMAAKHPFLSIGFIFWFGMVMVLMVVYAVVWQQILKRMPLTVAYANRPVTLIWGIIWGALIFKERITWNMILGAAIIFLGIYMVVSDHE